MKSTARAIASQTAFQVGAGCARRTREFFYDSRNHQQDAVDWYRGFCHDLGIEADPKVLDEIRSKVRLVEKAVGHETAGVIERLLAGMPSPLGLREHETPKRKRPKGKP